MIRPVKLDGSQSRLRYLRLERNWVPDKDRCLLGPDVGDAEVLELEELTEEPSETGGT